MSINKFICQGIEWKMQSYLINKNTTRFQIPFKGSKETWGVQELFSRQQQLHYMAINFIYNVICNCQNFHFKGISEPQTRGFGSPINFVLLSFTES